jgi:hypothetical protein
VNILPSSAEFARLRELGIDGIELPERFTGSLHRSQSLDICERCRLRQRNLWARKRRVQPLPLHFASLSGQTAKS